MKDFPVRRLLAGFVMASAATVMAQSAGVTPPSPVVIQPTAALPAQAADGVEAAAQPGKKPAVAGKAKARKPPPRPAKARPKRV
jgi:hypothetical protein